ncbi:hypothetical protein pb186bvf_008942 [Paramecium bursaria]
MAQTIIGAIKIKDGLFIGDEYASQDREFIITNKVTHIINCAGTQIANKWAQAGVKYLTFNWLENDQEILFDEKGDNVNKIFGFIEECFHQGESCLVHSVRGQSRSCCVLAAYFMKKYSWTLYKTLEYLNSRRPDLEIRASFFYQLNALESRLAKQGTKRTASWNELTHDDTEAFGQEELIIRNTFLNSHNGPVDEIYTNMQAKLNILNRNPQQKLKWRDVGSKENLAELVYNGSPDFIPISEIIAKELQIQSILKGAKKTKTLVVKPPQGTGNVQKSQQSLSTQSNSQVRSVSSKSQAESQESQQVNNQGQNPISNNSQIQNTNQLTSILQSNPSFNNLLLNCSLKSRTPSQQDNLKKAQPLQNNFMKPPLQSDGGVRSNSLQQNDEKNKAAENQRTNSLKSKESQKELQQTNSVLTNFQEFKNQVQQSLNYFNKQTESIPPQMKEDQKKQSKLDQLISPTVINSISSTKHSEIQKTLSQSISQLQSSYQKFQQLQMKNQQGMKQSQSTTQIMKEPVQVSEIQQINKTADISNLRKQLEQKNNRPSSAEVKDKSLSKDKKESLSPFSKEVKPMKIQQGPPLPQSSSQLYLRNVQCRRQAASTLRNQQKPNNSFQDKYLNQSANNQQNNSFNNNSNSQIDSENKTQVIKQFAQQTITDLNQFKKLVSPQSLTKSQAQFAKNQPIKVLQELTDKTASQKQVKQKDNISMSFTLQKPAQNTRTFSPVVKVVEGKAKNGNPNIRHKIRNSSPGTAKDQDSSNSLQNASYSQKNWKVL